MPSPYDCTKDTCPASESIIGYAPSLWSGVLFAVLFSVSTIVHAYQGWRYKTWSFLVAMVLGCALEAVGYGGRIMLSNDAFSDPGFKLQVVLLTFAPAFLAGGIYFTLKHIVLTFGEDISRIPPNWYTYIFISCDLLSIVMQGAGGGIASGASDGDNTLLKAGDNTMIAGLAFQVFTLIVFGILVSEYAWRVHKNSDRLNPTTVELRSSRKFRWFLVALAVAYFAILIRCIYRVAEMAGGWGSSIMRVESAFIVLDSV